MGTCRTAGWRDGTGGAYAAEALEVEPAFSTVKVTDVKGRRVDRNDAQVGGANRELMRVSVEALGPGDYTVVWRAVSTDTHVTEGDFVFHVGQ
jgi:methionine-rich copper-binding protein CopC